MTVSTYNPVEKAPVNFSAAAVKHLTKQVALHNAKGIEFKVKESGCSGYKYLLELVQQIESDTNCYPIAENLDLYISPKAMVLISGTQVDYVQQGVNFQLVFKNPNATASCGCGESFSVDPQV